MSKRSKLRMPERTMLEKSKLSRHYRMTAAARRTAAMAHAPVIAALAAVMGSGVPQDDLRAWLTRHRASLTVDSETTSHALRMCSEWWQVRGERGFGDPLPGEQDEHDDFWLWARELLKYGGERMALQLTFTGDSLADILRQVTVLAQSGLESVPPHVDLAAGRPSVDAKRYVPPEASATLEQVTERLKSVAAKFGEGPVRQILAGYGVTRVDKLPADAYGRVMAEAALLF